MMTHNDKVGRAGQRRVVVAVRTEVHRVNRLMHNIIHVPAATVDKGQGIMRTGDSSNKLAVIMTFQSIVPP